MLEILAHVCLGVHTQVSVFVCVCVYVFRDGLWDERDICNCLWDNRLELLLRFLSGWGKCPAL